MTNYFIKWWDSYNSYPDKCCDCSCDPEKGGLESSETSWIDCWSLLHIVFGAAYSTTIFIEGVNEVGAFFICLFAAILYEMIENTNFGVWVGSVICCAPHYQGDNFWNSVMDVLFNLLGFAIVVVIKGMATPLL